MAEATVVLDTNIFVAAGFNHNSASARILDQVRSGQLRLIWNEQTWRETEYIVSKIPPLSWNSIADLFRKENRYRGDTMPENYLYIPDEDDRKFAALAEATGAILITNDDDLLNIRAQIELKILTPAEYWEQLQK